jgi:hypothetical protein
MAPTAPTDAPFGVRRFIAALSQLGVTESHAARKRRSPQKGRRGIERKLVYWRMNDELARQTAL